MFIRRNWIRLLSMLRYVHFTEITVRYKFREDKNSLQSRQRAISFDF